MAHPDGAFQLAVSQGVPQCIKLRFFAEGPAQMFQSLAEVGDILRAAAKALVRWIEARCTQRPKRFGRKRRLRMQAIAPDCADHPVRRSGNARTCERVRAGWGHAP